MATIEQTRGDVVHSLSRPARTAASPQRLGVPPARRASDEDLVARSRAGDARAFGELSERHTGRLRRVLFRITRNCEQAWDAVQEALTRAWQNIDSFEGRSQFSTWLTRIGINEAYRAAGRATPELLEPTDRQLEVPDHRQVPERVFESREFLAALERALERLPCDHQTAVRLRDVDGLTTREAAEALGIGERALKSRLHRGRNALRRELEPYLRHGYA